MSMSTTSIRRPGCIVRWRSPSATRAEGDQSLFPDVRDVRFDRVRVARAERAYRIVGAETRRIRSVAITNSRFDVVAAEAVVQYADDVKIRNVRIGDTRVGRRHPAERARVTWRSDGFG